MVKVREDMTGWVMKERGVSDSRLTVIKQAEDYIRPDGRRESRWICNCECGNQVIACGTRIKNGDIKSCGCLLQDKLYTVRSNCCKCNTYDLSGEYGIGYTDNNEEFWFDLEDYDKIKDCHWKYNSDGYVAGYHRQYHKMVKLHRLVLDIRDSSIEVDHIVHPPRTEHKIDNRKANLRVVNHSQNCMNTAMYKNNSSGYRGVSWHSRFKKWLARIQVNGKNIHLGYFSDKKDACRAYEKASNIYFGEYKYEESR